MQSLIDFVLLYWQASVSVFIALIFLLFCLRFSPLPFFLQWLSYYPRYFFGRLRLSAKLKKVRQKEGASVFLHRRHFCFARPGDADCEFSVVTPKACYAVKLFGHANRHLKITLTDQEVYYTQKPIISKLSFSEEYHISDRRTNKDGSRAFYDDFHEPKMHKIPNYRFFSKGSAAEVTPVLLINPCPNHLYYRKTHSNKASRPFDSDRIGEMTLFSLTGLLKQIEEDCK